MTGMLEGRRYLVTGAGRREGIAWAVVERLVADGARVVAQAWPLEDAVTLEPDTAVPVIEMDFAGAEAPEQAVTIALQRLGGLDGAAAYAISKGAIHQMALTLSAALAERGVTVNAINPGPVDTAWAGEPLYSEIRQRFPRGNWTTATQVADVVAWLLTPEASIITGQVLNAENGFRRS